MKAQRMALATFMAVVLTSAATGAQWLNHATPGIPRLPDGKPNLSAPAPRLKQTFRSTFVSFGSLKKRSVRQILKRLFPRRSRICGQTQW